MPAGPLSGVKVLDLTIYQNGPSCTGVMADYGAEVIKLEPPQGEGIRYLASRKDEFNSGYEVFNRGKKSLTLDLKHPDAREVMRRLVQWADVLAENFRPGVLGRLGFGYETCRGWNPRLIYASNFGFGPAGSWAERPSYDAVAQAFAGAMHQQGGGPSHRPQLVEWTFSDEVGAMNFYGAIVAALYARERTGRGEQVQTSQVGATLQFQRASILSAYQRGFQRDDGRPAGASMRHIQQVHQCADGRWIIFSVMQQAQAERYVRDVLRAPGLLADPRGATFAARGQHKDWFLGSCAAIVATKPRAEWLALALAANVPCGPVHTYDDLRGSEHLRANHYIRDVDHPQWGRLAVVAPPVAFSGTGVAPAEYHYAPAPQLGEHTAGILGAVGFSAAEVARLEAGGAARATAAFGPAKL